MCIYSKEKVLYSVNVYVFIPILLFVIKKMCMHEDGVIK